MTDDRVGLGHERAELVEHERVVAGRSSPSAMRSATSPTSVSMPPPNDEPLPIDTRSLASVVRASGQPPSHLADHAVVGHEHVVEEDLVEHLQPGQLAQRADVDARARTCRP